MPQSKPLNAVLHQRPDHAEPAGPFPAEVIAHARCLHPARRHSARQVTVLAVLERTAVVADARDIHWVERHDAVLVDPDQLRWRRIAEQRVRDTESRLTGQRRSKHELRPEAASRRDRPRTQEERMRPPERRGPTR